MLRGSIIRNGQDYSVKVGAISVDVTDDVRALIAQEIKQACLKYDQDLAELRARHVDVINRYEQIARIVRADGAGMPAAGMPADSYRCNVPMCGDSGICEACRARGAR